MPQNSADATDLHFLLLAFCFPWKVSCYQHTPVKRPKYCIVNRDSIGKAGFLILTLDVDFPSYSRSTGALRSVPGWLGPLMSSLPSQELSKRMHYKACLLHKNTEGCLGSPCLAPASMHTDQICNPSPKEKRPGGHERGSNGFMPMQPLHLNGNITHGEEFPTPPVHRSTRARLGLFLNSSRTHHQWFYKSSFHLFK